MQDLGTADTPLGKTARIAQVAWRTAIDKIGKPALQAGSSCGVFIEVPFMFTVYKHEKFQKFHAADNYRCKTHDDQNFLGDPMTRTFWAHLEPMIKTILFGFDNLTNLPTPKQKTILSKEFLDSRTKSWGDH